MLLWIVLFFIIIAISFLMAFQSMKDFAERPAALGKDYSLFLIRNPQAISVSLLTELHQASLRTGHIITLERLFKGVKSAAVIFGPKSILELHPDLNLLELEDYTATPNTDIVAWEVGTKDLNILHFYLPTVFKQLPKLAEAEQFWWQLTLQANKSKLWPAFGRSSSVMNSLWDRVVGFIGFNAHQVNLQNLRRMIVAHPELAQVAEARNQQPVFLAQIRAVVVAATDQRRIEIASQMESIDGGKLAKLPKMYSSEQILELYRARAKLLSTFNPLNLTVDEALYLYMQG